MAEERGKQPGAGQRSSAPRRMMLAGRLRKRERGVLQIDLVEGLTVDVMEDDCEVVEETTDAVTQRPMIAIELKGDKPLTATFQPHLYRVLAEAGAVPFPFGQAAQVPPDQFAVPSVLAAARGTGGGGGGIGGRFQPSISETDTRSQAWTGGWYSDDNQLDTKDDSIF